MIKKFLKIAGVKTEEDFYKKYPSEAAFFKAHPEAKHMRKLQGGGEQHKLNQLTDFSNDPDNLIGTYTQQQSTPVDVGSFRDARGEMFYGMTGMHPAYMDQIVDDPGEQLKNIGSSLSEAVSSLKGKGRANKGKKVPKAQNARVIPQLTGITTTENPYMWGSNTGGIGGQQAPANPNPKPFEMDKRQTGTFAKQVEGSKNAVNPNVTPKTNPLDKIGGAMGVAQIAANTLGALGQMKTDRQNMLNAKKWALASGVVNTAATMRKDLGRRRYVRAEDVPINQNEVFPSYGTGSEPLSSRNGSMVRAEGGAEIGGNPTEIQNTYDPIFLYSDLGYEPLGESTQVKQFQYGGMAGNIGSALVGGTGSGAGQLGSTIGGTAGMLIGGPAGEAIGGFLGGAVGGMFGARTLNKTKAYQKQMMQNIDTAAYQSMLQGANSPYMRDGGWVSHDWQPQVITRFGEYSLKDLLAEDPEMDTLRTGGNISKNYISPQDEYSFGGSVKSHWGGGSRLFSQNRFLPYSGEMEEYHGQSHEESDGKGRTGIGISYGDSSDNEMESAEYGTDAATDQANVEVERGEYGVQLPDAKTGEPSLNIYGNLIVNKDAAKAIGDDYAEGMKYKNYAKYVGKQTNKLNKKDEKITNMVSETDDTTTFGKLRMNSLEKSRLGINMQLKRYADRLTNAALYQNATNDTADYLGIEADALAKNGKIVISKEKMAEDKQTKKELYEQIQGLLPMARNGKSIKRAQKGIEWKVDPYTPPGWGGGASYDQAPAYGGGAQRTGAYTEISDGPLKAVIPTGARPVEPGADASTPTASRRTGAKRKSGVAVLEPKPTDYKTDYDYMNALYEAAQKQGKGPLVAKFQREFHERYPDFSIDISRKAPEGVTSAGKLNNLSQKELMESSDVKGVLSRNNEDGIFGKRTIQYKQFLDKNKPTETPGEKPKDVPVETKDKGKKSYNTPGGEKSKGFTWMDALAATAPMFLPSDVEELDPRQLAGEMAAMATNQLEPVQAQLYQPLLAQAYDVSYQDQLNEITSQTRAAEKLVRNNPSALAAIYAEANAAKRGVLGEEFRVNQAMQANTFNQNRQTLNDAALKNIELLDRQYVRQAEAKSRTKEVAQAALNSISSKFLQNQRDNRELQVYENMYNYRFDDKFRARNYNVFNPNIPTVGNPLVPVYDSKNNIVAYRPAEDNESVDTGDVTTTSGDAGKKTVSRNGSKNFKNSLVVKSFKNI